MIEKLLQSFRDMFDAMVEAAPSVLTAIGLLILALILAKIVEKTLRLVLVRVKFDSLIGRAGIDTALQRLGLKHEMSHFIPRLVYLLLLILVANTLADALGLTAVSSAFAAFFAYLPNLLAALVLVLLGGTAGPFVGRTVAQAAENAGIDFGPSLGRLVSGLILFVVGIMAIGQLKIDTEIIRLVTGFCLAGFALAFGLSFGLGTRDLTRSIVAGFYARKILRVGEEVEIGGECGVLTAVTPTHASIERDGHTVHVANSKFLDEISRQ